MDINSDSRFISYIHLYDKKSIHYSCGHAINEPEENAIINISLNLNKADLPDYINIPKLSQLAFYSYERKNNNIIPANTNSGSITLTDGVFRGSIKPDGFYDGFMLVGDNLLLISDYSDKPVSSQSINRIYAELVPQNNVSDIQNLQAKPSIEDSSYDAQDLQAKPSIEDSSYDTQDSQAKPSIEDSSYDTQDLQAKPSIEDSSYGLHEFSCEKLNADTGETANLLNAPFVLPAWDTKIIEQDLHSYTPQNDPLSAGHKSKIPPSVQGSVINVKNPLEDAPAARTILNNGSRYFPFRDTEFSECVRIKPQDIGILPPELWHIGNNSFLHHAYHIYGHLLFARRIKHSKREYFILVPGTYCLREKQLAGMYGFRNFKTIACTEPVNGSNGYWYIPLNL